MLNSQLQMSCCARYKRAGSGLLRYRRRARQAREAKLAGLPPIELHSSCCLLNGQLQYVLLCPMRERQVSWLGTVEMYRRRGYSSAREMREHTNTQDTAHSGHANGAFQSGCFRPGTPCSRVGMRPRPRLLYSTNVVRDCAVDWCVQSENTHTQRRRC